MIRPAPEAKARGINLATTFATEPTVFFAARRQLRHCRYDQRHFDKSHFDKSGAS